LFKKEAEDAYQDLVECWLSRQEVMRLVSWPWNDWIGWMKLLVGSTWVLAVGTTWWVSNALWEIQGCCRAMGGMGGIKRVPEYHVQSMKHENLRYLSHSTSRDVEEMILDGRTKKRRFSVIA
jgi:hypothetical protein